jgi:KUP system potassium uptake protein
MTSVQPARQSASSPQLAASTVAALGVVFGDIGTSPLYTLKTVLGLGGGQAGAATALGALSLIIWTLFIITSVKYVGFAMRIGNDGEGGIIALMALLGVKRQHRPAIIAAGLFGAALIYGDGAITPAISVLSAVEGVQQIAPALQAYVLPLTVAVLVVLFAVQPLGTARIGGMFGPLMLVWFAAIAVLGIHGVIQHPGVLVALNPYYGFSYLANGGSTAFFVLGGVFLCVTGAEALYADMGHFGTRPIRVAWSAIVFPSLILNYAGQTAIVLDGAPLGGGNIFYLLCPSSLLIPLVVLATIATVIASQSIITGAFSMTRQAIQLGWLPRLRVTQTSQQGYGQIYVGTVNWLLMVVTLGLAVGFGRSDNLAAAYGIAVSLTMLMTSVLMFIAMRDIWGWPLPAAAAIAGVFIVVDGSFFAANMSKVLDGGFVPLLLAFLIYGVMWVWHRGAAAVQASVATDRIPFPDFIAKVHAKGIARVPGSGVFLTRVREGTPPVLAWHVRQNRSLHASVLVLTLIVASTPRVRDSERIAVHREDEKLWRAEVHYGFMERLDIFAVLAECKAKGAEIDLEDVTFYVGRETIVPRTDGRGIPRWQEAIFAVMQRNAARLSDYLRLPYDHVVEIGREIAI